MPLYTANLVNAYSKEERMKHLEPLDRYQTELATITSSKNIPSEWVSPVQRCRAAIKAMAQVFYVHYTDY